jgi:hypothetical protein
MTTRRATRRLVLALALAAQLAPASASAMGGEGGGGAGVETPATPSYAAPDAGDDPRLRRTGPEERALRQVGDAVFSRPFHLVRLLAGVAMLPIALPIAAVFADWRDAVDVCVTGPYGMAFQRPLGD